MFKPVSLVLVPAAVGVAACTSDAPLSPDPPLSHHSAAALAPGGGPNPLVLKMPTLVHRSEMSVEHPPEDPFLLIHVVLDFQPHTWFPAHVHGGPTLYTVVEGSVTVHEEGSTTEHHAGEGYEHDPAQVLAAGNSSDEPAAMAVAFVLPDGEEMITFEHHDDGEPELPPPGIMHDLAVGPLVRSSGFSVIQLVLELEPGTWAPAHVHPGPSLFTVLEGEIAHRSPRSEEQLLPRGEGWIVTAGEPTMIGNRGQENARVVGTYLVPKGESLGVFGR